MEWGTTSVRQQLIRQLHKAYYWTSLSGRWLLRTHRSSSYGRERPYIKPKFERERELGTSLGADVLLAVPAGYPLARMTGAWAQTLASRYSSLYLVPPTILFIPFSRIIAILGLQESVWSLILVYPSFTVPFCTWLLMGFFKTIPRDLEDAAMIDGLSRSARPSKW